MLWWFLILAGSAGIVLMAGVAIYLRVQRHLKHTGTHDHDKDH